MNILFIINNGINESLIIPDIIAYLKAKKHKVDLFITNEERNMFRNISVFNPQMIILPTPIYDKNWYFDFAKRIKQNFSSSILFWGASATFYPETVLKNAACDFICRGEGEYAIAELADRIEQKKSYKDVRNIGYINNGNIILNPLRPLVNNLDELPLPDRSVYYKYPFLRNINMKRFLISRGCKQLCRHCWNNAISNVYNNPDDFYRRKSPQRIIEEIINVKEKYPLTSVHFSDDLFFHPDYQREFFEFIELYKQKVNIRFTCNIRPDFITNEIAKSLRGSNCHAIAISVESGCPRLRNEILGKKINDGQIITAAKIIHKNNMKLMTFNIMAIHSEQLTDIYKTIEFNNSIRPEFSRIITLFPISNSDLYEYTKINNLLEDEPFNKISDINTELYNATFHTGDKIVYANIFLLFSFSIKFMIATKFIKILTRLPLFYVYKLIFILVSNINEKRFFGVNFFSGLRYFLHTKGVSKRSENLTSIY
ncbi:MAG: radical SAM protein [Candidatus Omnitrophica bacterium]|nr:radical SAM protein [Candidatus Omnitrophota bacterium]